MSGNFSKMVRRRTWHGSRRTRVEIDPAYRAVLERYPVLSREELENLFRFLRKVDGTVDNVILDKIVNHNLSLVVKVALTFAERGSNLDDAIQAGNMGLIEAVRSFNSNRACSFATYAPDRIYAAIQLIQTNTTLPKYLSLELRTFEFDLDKLRKRLNRWPSVREIAAHLGLSIYEVENKLFFLGQRTVPLEQDFDSDGEGALVDILTAKQVPQPATRLEAEEELAIRRRELSLFFSSLEQVEIGKDKKTSELKREAFKRRYGLGGFPPHFQEEVRKVLKITSGDHIRKSNVLIWGALADLGTFGSERELFREFEIVETLQDLLGEVGNPRAL